MLELYLAMFKATNWLLIISYGVYGTTPEVGFEKAELGPRELVYSRDRLD